MNHNVGTYDRIIRISAGILLLFLGFNLTIGLMTYIIFLLAAVLLITGIIGWCGLYSHCNYSSRAQGINRISKEEIQALVKDEKIKEETPKTKVKKPSTKKAVKKTTTKKSTKKKATKKTTKKTTKKATKKVAKK